MRQYIGARYVPKIAEPFDWNDQTVYEPLTIVGYNGSSYTSRKTSPAGTPPTDTEYWALTGSLNGYVSELQKQLDALSTKVEAQAQSISSNATEIVNINNVLNDYVTPDDFPGTTDTEKLQAALNSMSKTGGTIVLNRVYQVTESLSVTSISDSVLVKTTFVGMGKASGLNIATGVTAFTGSGFSVGGLQFINVTFRGAGSTVFGAGSGLIRISCIGCQFYDMAYVVNTPGYIQTYTFTECFFKKITTRCFNCQYLYNVTFNNCAFEDLEQVMKCHTDNITDERMAQNLAFTNCLIEGIAQNAIVVNNIRGLTVDSCYFEDNKYSVEFEPGSYMRAVSYTNNIHNICTGGIIISGKPKVFPIGVINDNWMIQGYLLKLWTGVNCIIGLRKYNNSAPYLDDADPYVDNCAQGGYEQNSTETIMFEGDTQKSVQRFALVGAEWTLRTPYELNVYCKGIPCYWKVDPQGYLTVWTNPQSSGSYPIYVHARAFGAGGYT